MPEPAASRSTPSPHHAFVHAPPRVVAYDPSWPALFATEAVLLSTTLASTPHVVEHIGSTAVPGLPAKPVIDVMVGLLDPGALADEQRFDGIRDALGIVGYLWDPAAALDDPARAVFRKGPADASRLRSHHLHLTDVVSPGR